MASIRSDFRNDIPMPEPPPSGLRRCSGCKQYKRCDLSPYTEFSTQICTRAGGRKVRYWRGRCKRCEADREQARKRPRGKVDPRTTAENKARRRAMTRLTQIAPTVYLPLLREELRQAYRELGVSEDSIPAMIEERVQHVHRYIEALGDA